MPKPDKSAWQFTPSMVNNISQLSYTYDDLSLGVMPILANKNTLRLRNWGLQLSETKIISADMKQNTKSELVGANNDSIVLDASGTRTGVRLDSKGWDNVTKSLNKLLLTENLKEITSNDIPDEIYLQLEGVKGKEDSIICTVSVNHQYVGHISLFGLHNATSKDGTHGGGGLTIKLDITKVVDKMQINNLMDVNSLDILIQPVNMITKGNELTIERISIYRKTQQ